MRYITIVVLFSAFMQSCATLQPADKEIKINLLTVDSEQNPIDAVCNLYSSSSKLDVIAPKKFMFVTQCSSINIVCKSGQLTGEYGVIEEQRNTSADNFIINSGIGYIFDRAVDAVTPLGSLMNLMSSDEEDCITERNITIVLE